MDAYQEKVRRLSPGTWTLPKRRVRRLSRTWTLTEREVRRLSPGTWTLTKRKVRRLSRTWTLTLGTLIEAIVEDMDAYIKDSVHCTDSNGSILAGCYLVASKDSPSCYF